MKPSSSRELSQRTTTTTTATAQRTRARDLDGQQLIHDVLRTSYFIFQAGAVALIDRGTDVHAKEVL
jgi:hypothetical protein